MATLRSILFISAAFASTAWAQSIFINNVPEYDQLATCAEQPLSVIVRSMASGCGDGSQTTSYACFCSSSSAKFSSIISREVDKTCSGNDADARSALDVFSAYCQIGAAAVPTVTGDSTASSAPTPVNTATTMATSTTGATAPVETSPVSSSSLSSKSKIVIGVVVPVGVLLIIGGMLAAALVIRSHRRRAAARNENMAEGGIAKKTISEDSSTDHGSNRSPSPTASKVPFEMESPLAEKQEPTALAELPTDGRYGNGTTAHELQE